MRLIGLLRAVNVGGTGRLEMAALRALCLDIGFTDVATYIQSGNLVFSTRLGEAEARAALEAALARHMGAEIGILIRTPGAMRAARAANPFDGAEPSNVAIVFLDAPPPPDSIETARGRKDEEIALGERELHIHYPSGMGRSRLTLKGLGAGTARNLNTVDRLIAMAKGV